MRDNHRLRLRADGTFGFPKLQQNPAVASIRQHPINSKLQLADICFSPHVLI